MTLIEHWEENKREDFDGGRQKDKTVIQYLWGISDSKLFHWEMRLMTDLIWGSDIAAGLHIRTKTADDNIYSKKKGGEGLWGGENVLFQRPQAAAAAAAAVCLPSVHSRNVPSPARVTGSLSSYQIRTPHLPSPTYLLTAQFFFVGSHAVSRLGNPTRC